MAIKLPPNAMNTQGKPRKIGVEIEFSGMPANEALDIVHKLFGGRIVSSQPFVHHVRETELGDFKIELDASYAIKMGKHLEGEETALPLQFAQKAIEQIVPWEIVTAPIEIPELSSLQDLIAALRKAGALGTRHAWYYAFGLHLNPEIISTQTDSILNHIRAYIVLYDWIKREEQVDVARQLTTYINHYRSEYIARILDLDYQPDQNALIDDYLEQNPTRNRGLDLLPLFSWLDEHRVLAKIEDERIQARPTFHYRLPNCDIDNPSWNIDKPWNRWVQVETLAANTSLLAELCDRYLKNAQRLASKVDSSWENYISDLVVSNKII